MAAAGHLPWLIEGCALPHCNHSRQTQERPGCELDLHLELLERAPEVTSAQSVGGGRLRETARGCLRARLGPESGNHGHLKLSKKVARLAHCDTPRQHVWQIAKRVSPLNTPYGCSSSLMSCSLPECIRGASKLTFQHGHLGLVLRTSPGTPAPRLGTQGPNRARGRVVDRERGRCNGSEVLVPLGWPDEPDRREIAVRLGGFRLLRALATAS